MEEKGKTQLRNNLMFVWQMRGEHPWENDNLKIGRARVDGLIDTWHFAVDAHEFDIPVTVLEDIYLYGCINRETEEKMKGKKKKSGNSYFIKGNIEECEEFPMKRAINQIE